jgi:hypothetical protein
VWIRRNYEVLNPLEPEPELLAAVAPREAAPRFLFEDTDDRVVDGQPGVLVEQENEATRAPAASMEPDVQSAQATLADVFQSGEPPVEEDDAHRPEAYTADHHWDRRNREPWQLHSEQGPNVGCEGRVGAPVVGDDVVVNPLEHAYGSTSWTEDDLDRWHRAWDALRARD